MSRTSQSGMDAPLDVDEPDQVDDSVDYEADDDPADADRK